MENRILDKLDSIQDDISEMKVTLARNTDSLEIHIRRTFIAEENIQLLRNRVDSQSAIVNDHISKVKGAAWLLGALGALLVSLNQLGMLKF